MKLSKVGFKEGVFVPGLTDAPERAVIHNDRALFIYNDRVYLDAKEHGLDLRLGTFGSLPTTLVAVPMENVAWMVPLPLATPTPERP